jgi:hypothetical protein
LEVVVEAGVASGREEVRRLEQPQEEAFAKLVFEMGVLGAAGEVGGLAWVVPAVVELGPFVEPFDVAPVRGSDGHDPSDELGSFVLDRLLVAVLTAITCFQPGLLSEEEAAFAERGVAVGDRGVGQHGAEGGAEVRGRCEVGEVRWRCGRSSPRAR